METEQTVFGVTAEGLILERYGQIGQQGRGSFAQFWPSDGLNHAALCSQGKGDTRDGNCVPNRCPGPAAAAGPRALCAGSVPQRRASPAPIMIRPLHLQLHSSLHEQGERVRMENRVLNPSPNPVCEQCSLG